MQRDFGFMYFGFTVLYAQCLINGLTGLLVTQPSHLSPNEPEVLPPIRV